MERLPNSSSRAYGPKTELSRMRACVRLGCLSTWLEFVTLGVWISTSCHHPFPPTCRYCHRSCPGALSDYLPEENTKRLQTSANRSKAAPDLSSTRQLEPPVTSGLESLPAMASEPLEVERLDRGVLSFRGPLTMENVTPFMNAVRRETAPTMILDFSGVPYLDSSGLGSLVSACTSCAKAGRRIAITGVNKRVLKVFEITKVEQILLMFPTLSDAIEAFTNAGTA